VIPIVTCTIGSPCLAVLEASVKAYCPGVEMFISRNRGANFGEAYNIAVNEAFEKYDEIIVANDDIVLTPTAYTQLLKDVSYLKTRYKLGWVVARADEVRHLQQGKSNKLFKVQVVSPLFGYISKEAWVDFPPINWYSDDIQSLDIREKGYRHFLSKAYIHHVGSSTIGQDNTKNHLDAEPWIKANRPELHQIWFQQERKVA
jgi:hypothetical protein